MDFVAGGEMNFVHFIHHIPQQIAIDHPVDGAFEDLGDDIPAVAVGALERT